MKFYSKRIPKSKAPKNDWTEYKKLILKYAEDTLIASKNIEVNKYVYKNTVTYVWGIPEFDSLGLRIQKAEKLLKDITMTGSHYQVKEKIDRYFRRIRQNDQSRIKI